MSGRFGWGWWLVVALVTSVAGVVPSAGAALPNPIGWWQMDEGSGTNAFDSSGNGKTGTFFYNGGTPLSPTWTNGVQGGGLQFTLARGVRVPFWAGYQRTNSLSLAVWIRLAQPWEGPPGEYDICATGSYNNGWGLRYNVGRYVTFHMTGANGNTVSSGVRLPTNRWVHVVATFDGTNASLYLNGQLDRRRAWSGQVLTNSNGFWFGTLPGAMDDVRIYDECLGEAAVRQLYAHGDRDGDGLADADELIAGTSSTQPDSDGDGFADGVEIQAETNPLNAASVPDLATGLVGHWPFNEGSGATTADSTGFGNTGTLTGSLVWTNGLLGQALTFNGSNTYVTCGTSGTNNVLAINTNVFTAAFWARVKFPIVDSIILERREYTPVAQGYTLKWDNTYNRVTCGLVGVSFQDWNTAAIQLFTVATNVWHHYAFTYNGTQLVSYVNGTRMGATAASNNIVATATQPLYLGQNRYFGARWPGTLDDLRLYKRNLTAGEIWALAQGDTDGDGIPNIQEARLGTDPTLADTDDDDMPDGWEIQYGLNPLDPADAAGDLDSDGISNLDEHLAGTDPTDPDITPPEITAQISPSPNAAGWNNTNVVVSFTATDAGSGVAFVTSPVTVTTETNDCEIIGLARDYAGNVATTSVFINIDKTPPDLALDPGQGDTFDNSHPLLIVEYSDQLSAVSAQPAGLKPDSLTVTLDSVSITNQFHRFASRAVATITNLNAGTHTWSASITDYAGNITSTTVVFTATGTVNTNAPVMSAVNLTDEITLMPDVPEIWVQGKVSGQSSVVSASVNGGEAIPMNRRGDDFGFLLPLDYGKNVIVLYAGDGQGNMSSKMFIVERTDKFRAVIESPAFGEFANGRELSVSGKVSAKYAEGTEEELGLAGVSVNGIAAELGAEDENGNVAFATVGAVNSETACVGSIMPLIMELCWTNVNGELVFPGVDAVTNTCPNVPLGLLEGYEVVEKHTLEGEVEPRAGSGLLFPYGLRFYIGVSVGPGYTFPECSNSVYLAAWGVKTGWGSEFVVSNCVGQLVGVQVFESTNSCVDVAAESSLGWVKVHDGGAPTNALPGRGLVWEKWHRTLIGGPCIWTDLDGEENGWWPDWTNMVAAVDHRWTGSEGTLTFTAPLNYGPDTTVIFTLEGVEVEGLALSNLTLWGQAPIAVDETTGNVSYLLTVTGGALYTLDESAFNMPALVTTNYTSTESDFMMCYPEVTESYRRLRFTGFHNAMAQFEEESRFSGFTLDPTPPTYWLVVPSGGKTNGCIAKISVTSSDAGDTFHFVTAHGDVAQVNPTNTTVSGGIKRVLLTVTGRAVGDTTIEIRQGSATGHKHATLNVKVLPPKEVTVTFVKPVAVDSGVTEKNEAYAQTALLGLNRVWNRQANIFFVGQNPKFWQEVNVGSGADYIRWGDKLTFLAPAGIPPRFTRVYEIANTRPDFLLLAGVLPFFLVKDAEKDDSSTLTIGYYVRSKKAIAIGDDVVADTLLDERDDMIAAAFAHEAGHHLSYTNSGSASASTHFDHNSGVEGDYQRPDNLMQPKGAPNRRHITHRQAEIANDNVP